MTDDTILDEFDGFWKNLSHDPERSEKRIGADIKWGVRTYKKRRAIGGGNLRSAIIRAKNSAAKRKAPITLAQRVEP